MAFQVKFQSGQTATFENKPTDKDIDEVASRIGAQRQEPARKKGLLAKAAGALDVVFGGGKVGEAIGTAAARAGLTGLSKEERQFVGKGPSAGEVAGSAARSALLFTPVGRGAQALGAGARALGIGQRAATGIGRVGTGAATGLGFDVAGGLEAGQPIGEALKPGATTAIGAALPVVGGVAQKATRALAEKIPRRLVSSALKLTPKEAASKSGEKAVQALLSGRVGTQESIIRGSKEALDSLNTKIASNLKGIPKARIGKTEIAKQIQASPFFKDAALEVDEVIEEVIRRVPRAKALLVKPNLTLSEANRLRQIIDRTIGDPFFTAQNPGFAKEVLNAFARTLSDTIKIKAPTGTRQLFTDLSSEISLLNQLEKAATRGKGGQIIGFGDILGAGLGTAAGGPGGALGGIAARRAIQSTPFLTGAAQVSQRAGRAAQQIPQAGGAQSKLLLDLLQQARTNQPRQ